MNAASEFDLGPLTWIKTEIDLALQRATEALTQYAGSGDITHLKFARTHIHQAHGALIIVGLDGVAQISESLEALLVLLEEGQSTAAAVVFDAFELALNSIQQYLDSLLAGQPNQPLRLLPAYRILAEARGINHCHAADLFYPDLSARPGRRPESSGIADTPENQKAQVKSERTRYQKALLSFLKKPEAVDQAIGQMQEAITAIEALQDSPTNRTVWWIAQGFIETLHQPEIAADPRARQLCSHLDGQIRRWLEGNRTAPERLLRDALYFVAQVPSGFNAYTDTLQAAFQLARLLPDNPLDHPIQAHDATLRRLRDALASSEDFWNKFCAGQTNALAGFAEQGRLCNTLANDLGQTDLKRLSQAFSAIAGWLAEQPQRLTDDIAMEVATTILLLQNAIEQFGQLDTDFARQVDLMVARLYGYIAGKPAEDPGLPALDELTRKAQEKRLIAQVAREIGNNLIQVEQTLDDYFRDNSKADSLPPLDSLLKQIGGALAMLGHLGAATRIKACARQIEGFANPDQAPDSADFEALAKQLSLIGFFVEALPHGENNFEAFSDRLEGKVVPPPLENEPAAVDPQNEDKSAPLASPELDAELSGQPHRKAELPEPSADTKALAEAGHEAIDAELLAIFLEEAHTVLDTIASQLQILSAAPHQMEALITIRRSTHTLKGSGRMVGLVDLGEAAWEMEQTLNLWLRQEQAVNDDLLALIDDEFDLFSRWVASLENRQPHPDARPFITRTRALRGTDTLPQLAPAPEAAPTTLTVASEPDIDPQLHATAEALADLLAPECTVEPTPADTQTTTDESALLRSTPPETANPPAPTLYDIFREEAAGHLLTLHNSLSELQADPNAATTFAMTRAAHTLGGTAATVGLMPLHHLAIALEHALLRRDGSANPASLQDLEHVAAAIATLDAQFAELAAGQAPSEAGPHLNQLAATYPPAIAPPAPLPASEPEETATCAGTDLLSEPAPPETLDEQLLPLFLDEAQDQLQQLNSQLADWRKEPAQPTPPHAIARLLHTFKGNARMAGAMRLGEFTHLLESRIAEIAVSSPEAALFDEIESAFDTLASAVDQLRNSSPSPVEASEAETGQSAAAPASISTAMPERDEETGDSSPAQAASLRIPAQRVDQLVNEAGELSIARTRIEGEMRSLKNSLLDLTDNVIRLRRQLREIEIQAESQIQAHIATEPATDSPFDPLELDRFTRFQELTRFMAESVNDVATVQQNLLKNVDDANAALLAQARLNRQLQQELMSIRMLPFDSLSERLYRIVRQTAKAVDKRANLDIEGGQVEVDRSVLDKIQAPLEHMLRNAITHGIEERSVRLAADKPETGEISLNVAQEGNEIILSLRDDGRGLDHAAIRARAEALGLLPTDAAVDAAGLADFIFQPGFSTAHALSQVSGRGVGMDVVKTEVSALGGRIEIESEAGQGTTFRLYLPLTLAITQTLLLRTGHHIYAIPSPLIEQVLELKDKQLAALQAKGEAEWQNHHYPFHFLPHLLGDSTAIPEARRQHRVLLLRSGNQRVAVLVDELKGNQEVVVKNIGAQLARVVGIDGATVLGDGRIVLILNPVALASRSPHITLPAAPALTEQKPAVLPTVMVVDDSLTVRKITSRLLAREGYQVILAKDGVDALEQLHDTTPDVIISDVEMPRMDGFDLIRNIRADQNISHLPIIMVTSRTADKHRRHALDLGANHYLGKPYDETELLEIVAASFPKN